MCILKSPLLLICVGLGVGRRYLYFYRQTLELLVCRGVLAPEQTGLAVVSEAISGLWSNLPPERRAAFRQCTLGASPFSWMSCVEEPQADDCSQGSSQFPSQEEASTSSLLQEVGERGQG